MKEKKRIEIMEAVFRGEVCMRQAAYVLGVCKRHAYRIKKQIKEKGVIGAIHGNRGKICSRKLDGETEKRIVELRKERYKKFNDTHFTEKLLEEGISVSREKVRRVLRKSGIASPRKRRGGKYRSRRERRKSEGLMLQTDGSHHDWLEGRGPKLCIVGVIDDATSDVPAARFDDTETTEGYFEVFEKAFKTKGLPHSIYADKHSIFRTDRQPTIKEQLAGKKPMTQMGRALDELGITLIPAGSPQAKGRIERLWGTLQDRLISELRLAGAKTKKEAQAVLDRFLPQHNEKFGKKPASSASAWRDIPHGVDIKRILCWKYQRVVANDNTISFKGLTLQLPRVKPLYSLAGKKVDVLLLKSKIIEVYYKNMKIAGFANQKVKTEVA